MKSTTYISLDLQRPNFCTVYAVQNDLAARWAHCLITDGGDAWTPPSPCYLMIRYKRPDGVCGFYDSLEDSSPAWAVNADGSVEIAWVQTMLQVAGTAEVEINFYNGQAEKLTVCQFRLQIIPSAYDDGAIVDSEPYINVLSQQIAAVLEYAADLAGISATATGLPAGSSPTVTVSGGTGGNPYVLAFGIPKGDKGDTGATGPTGNNWPVGAGFLTVDANFNPATTFGGTWVRFKGGYLYAADDGDTVDATGNTKDGTGPETVDFSNGMAHVGFADSYTQKLYMTRAAGGATFTAGNKAPDSGSFDWTGASSETIQGAALSGSQTLDIEPTRFNFYVWVRTA